MLTTKMEQSRERRNSAIGAAAATEIPEGFSGSASGTSARRESEPESFHTRPTPYREDRARTLAGG